ncbi:prolipoprotein diacylglyceryl transferase [Microgenomates group bacterium]|nr:prolipoprotein diacylglyceryl transferase [Microgenomates group bacterium]
MENILRSVLFSWRGIELQTIPLFLVVGLLSGIFVYWRKIKYDSEYSEYEAVDGFLRSLLGGYLMGRAVFVLMNIDVLGLYPLNWINVVLYPGFNELSALVASGGLLFWWCKKHKFEAWMVLDFWVRSAFLGFAIYKLGYFAAGLGFGNATSMPWGIVFPHTITPHHPVQLYLAAALGIMFFVLGKIEGNYRTFLWYRGKRKTAQAGFVLSIGMISFGMINLGLSWLKPASFMMGSFMADYAIYAAFIVIGLIIMMVRSGRKIGRRK